MIIEIGRLKEYVDFDLSTEKLGHLLSMSGLEVESIDNIKLPDGKRTDTMELNVTPNRGYCLSYIGVAREVAGLLNKPLHLPETGLPPTGNKLSIESRLKFSNDAPDLCPRYTALMIEDVRPVLSPEWLQNNLRAMGLRPINSIVDVTNFVLMEYGQPLHAFDYDSLQGQTIQVRTAFSGEVFTSLTGKDLRLDSDALVIADGEKPVALAGVVGGCNSEVTESTRNVVLESACFNSTSVRKTAKKYAIHTDSSFRFERGIDFEAIVIAQERAARLILEFAGGNLCSGRIDHFPGNRSPLMIPLRISRVRLVLGKEIQRERIHNFLLRLGLKVQLTSEGFNVTIPFFRPNLTREIDLIEELARMEGFSEFKPTSPVAEIRSAPSSPARKAMSLTRETLCRLGYSEALSYSFTSQKDAEVFLDICAPDGGELISLSNPITEDMKTMRSSLLPGLLRATARNINKGQKPVKLFELGQVYYLGMDGTRKERRCLAVLLHGVHENTPWKTQGKFHDFYDLKGLVESLEAQFKLNLAYNVLDRFPLASGRGMEFLVENSRLGFFGELSSQIRESFDLPGPVFVMELDFDVLMQRLPDTVTYKPIAKYPETYRDLSILVEKTVFSESIEKLIHKAGGSILRKVELYDCFVGKKLPPEKKSLTFALSFQSPNKTLTDDEVNPIFEKIVQMLNEKMGATLRDA